MVLRSSLNSYHLFLVCQSCFIQLDEQILRPLVVVRVTGGDFLVGKATVRWAVYGLQQSTSDRSLVSYPPCPSRSKVRGCPAAPSWTGYYWGDTGLKVVTLVQRNWGLRLPLGPLLWIEASLDGCVFRWKTESVPTHWIQHLHIRKEGWVTHSWEIYIWTFYIEQL